MLSIRNSLQIIKLKVKRQGFPGGAVDKNLPADGGDTGSIQEDPTCRRATKPMRHNY